MINNTEETKINFFDPEAYGGGDDLYDLDKGEEG
jgi:hypothetical protein